MNLVDEQQLPGLEIHQQANDVAGALEGRRTGDAAPHPQLLGQDHRHRGLAQPGGAVEQDVIEGFIPRLGGLNRNPKNLFELALADVVRQLLRPKRVLPLQRLLLLAHSWIHQPRGRLARRC